MLIHGETTFENAFLQKSVTKIPPEIIVEAKVKAVDWVATSVLGITSTTSCYIILYFSMYIDVQCVHQRKEYNYAMITTTEEDKQTHKKKVFILGIPSTCTTTLKQEYNISPLEN